MCLGPAPGGSAVVGGAVLSRRPLGRCETAGPFEHDSRGADDVGGRSWLRLHEKGGKRHDVPAHHRAAAALDAYVEAGGLEEPKVALFQTVDPAARQLTSRALDRRLVLAMIKRRAATAGLLPATRCHTFRATGITKLYDRTADTVNGQRDRDVKPGRQPAARSAASTAAARPRPGTASPGGRCPPRDPPTAPGSPKRR